jgi:hypothetical protein
MAASRKCHSGNCMLGESDRRPSRWTDVAGGHSTYYMCGAV